MDEYPYVNVVTLVTHVHGELVPQALQSLFDRQAREPSELAGAAERLLDRVRSWETDAQMKAWLHSRASLRTWRALDFALTQMEGFLLRAESGDQPARNLAASLVGCPTPLNVVRLALRGPV